MHFQSASKHVHSGDTIKRLLCVTYHRTPGNQISCQRHVVCRSLGAVDWEAYPMGKVGVEI